MGGFLSGFGFGWNVEAMGFLYGFILSQEKVKAKICDFLNDHYYSFVAWSFVISLILGVAYLKFKYIWFWGDYLLRIILGIALISLVLSLTYRLRVGNRASYYLGKISYEIFLTHGFVMSLLVALNDSYFSLSSGVFILLTFGLTIILAVPFNSLNSLISKQIRRL